MIHIPDISVMRIRPSLLEGCVEGFAVKCVGGHARWLPPLGTLTLQADVVMDAAAQSALDYLSSAEARFDLEISYSQHTPEPSSQGAQCLSCAVREISSRELAMRPDGHPCRRYQMAIQAASASALGSHSPSAAGLKHSVLLATKR